MHRVILKCVSNIRICVEFVNVLALKIWKTWQNTFCAVVKRFPIRVLRYIPSCCFLKKNTSCILSMLLMIVFFLSFSILQKVNHTCDQCGQGFYHFSEFNTHMLRHSNVRPYMCGVCKRAAFFTSSQLNQHLLICGKDRKFQCEECGNVFKQERYLRNHIKTIHKKTPRFQCDQCVKNYAQMSGLYRHKIKEHKT